MPLNVIDELLVAKFAQSFEINPVAKWLPLEVEKVRRIGLLPSMLVQISSSDILCCTIVADLGPRSLLSLIACSVSGRGVHFG